MAMVSPQSRIGVARYGVAVVILTAVLYVASCLLPATSIGAISEESRPDPGWVHLIFGWLSGLKGLPAWSANFVLWAAAWCLLRSRLRAAALLGLAAALLGLTTLVSFKSDGRYSGYYLWQASQIVFAVGAVVAFARSRLRTETSRTTSGVVQRLSHARRLGLRWGLAGLLQGMLVGGAAGLWLASIVNSLYGIGGDNYSGPLSQTTEQEAWVYIRGLGLGLGFGGGLSGTVCGLMGCIWGIVEAKSASSVRPEPESSQSAERGAQC